MIVPPLPLLMVLLIMSYFHDSSGKWEANYPDAWKDWKIKVSNGISVSQKKNYFTCDVSSFSVCVLFEPFICMDIIKAI
jgi:hypothetical protein